MGRREELWRAIEQRYGAPIGDVIRRLRHEDGGRMWREVADILGVDVSTLRKWRRALGIVDNGRVDRRWRGKRNPGHLRREELWRAIEEEYGAPVAQVIQELREIGGGNSWRTVAGVLGVSLTTLQEWRKALGLPLDQNKKVYDPSSKSDWTPADRKAQALGYRDMREAVLDLRVCKRMTVRDVAEAIGVHPTTVSCYTPPEWKGLIGRSERWERARMRNLQKAIEANRKRRSGRWRDDIDAWWRRRRRQAR